MRLARAIPMLVAVIAVLGACQASESPNQYAGLPSNACGGFHLKVVNQTGSRVQVALNGTWDTVIPDGTTLTINEGLSTPQPPQLPWQVVITDGNTGSQVFSATMPGPVDQKVTLTTEGPIQTPYDLSEDC
ncbi:MAG TPA: hypothetical protein VJ506_02735 [Candidatus Limnocylindrales bacterium]|nr:hypothetical protein [Candidatus Limnocylindrales bacterium]